MDFIHQTLIPLAPLSGEEWQAATPLFVKKELKKGEYFVRGGQICRSFAFIRQGLFRLFYQVDHEERIMLFFRENQLMADYFSFLTQTPSIRLVEALEDSVIYTLQYEDLQRLYQFKNWERFGRLVAENAYVYAIQRSNRLLHDDPDTRYMTLVQESPEILQRVPQYMIASYLQMTPETLSRIKRRIHEDKKKDYRSIHPFITNRLFGC